MTETEKQEGQKTVVAFITGLLIGGLLVWVFSSTPEEKTVTTSTETDVTDVDTTASGDASDSDSAVVKETEISNPVELIGEGKLDVADQKAGSVVTLGESSYPTKGGWIVVRELLDGMPSNILGAARFNVEEGLDPAAVELQRATVSGNSYQVGFFSDDGDRVFNLRFDQPVESATVTFKAE